MTKQQTGFWLLMLVASLFILDECKAVAIILYIIGLSLMILGDFR